MLLLQCKLWFWSLCGNRGLYCTFLGSYKLITQQNCYILMLSDHKTLKNSTVLIMPVVTSGFSLNSFFSYINVISNFALKNNECSKFHCKQRTIFEGLGGVFLVVTWGFWGFLFIFFFRMLNFIWNNVLKKIRRL